MYQIYTIIKNCFKKFRLKFHMSITNTLYNYIMELLVKYNISRKKYENYCTEGYNLCFIIKNRKFFKEKYNIRIGFLSIHCARILFIIIDIE